ncbi:MAG: bestrophin family ion channel [Isosphaeraceae bacterium]
MSRLTRQGFWREAFSVEGAITPRVLPRVIAFGAIALGVCAAAWLGERTLGRRLSLDITPHELAGAALGLLLVMRTNAGYDRWWEARKLWGGFVDCCRNVAIGGLRYGPDDQAWREQFARWVAAYPHVARHSLRGERPGAEVAGLIGPDRAAELGEADHMPAFVSARLADLLREGRERLGMEPTFFLQVDRERALLINNYGGCERILNTPLPRVYSLKIRHFIALYLMTLPLALLHRAESDWLVPLITMLVAYPLIALDQIGVELENPFDRNNLSHLPIDGIAATIERNVLALLRVEAPDAQGTGAGGTFP